jgi:hypothetical protein
MNQILSKIERAKTEKLALLSLPKEGLTDIANEVSELEYLTLISRK